jgi:hypothetical protein
VTYDEVANDEALAMYELERNKVHKGDMPDT